MKEQHRINGQLILHQHSEGLHFGTDAYLLAAYVRGSKVGKRREMLGCDLGAGTGVISLLCAAGGAFREITAVEIQEKYARLTEENCRVNECGDTVRPLCADVRQWDGGQNKGQYDAVFTNPPYREADSGLASGQEESEIARREHFGGIDAFTQCARQCLRFGGSFFCVYPPERITDLICSMRAHKIEPKRMTYVYPTAAHKPCIVLTEGTAGGKPGCFVTMPLILKDRDGGDTEEIKKLYERGCFGDEYLLP